MTLGEGDKRKVIYIKRFNYPHFKDLVSSIFDFGKVLSQAAIEWENANYLLSKGIGTYSPVCYGERTIFGLERKSFFVSEEVDGICLTDFVGERWGGMSRVQKEKLMKKLGRFVRRIHDAGINFPDLYVWHVFVTKAKAGEECDFSIIDLHRIKQQVKNRSKQVRNLGRFEYSMRDKYFDDSLRQVFIESYAGDERQEEIDKLAGKVKRYSKKILSRRNQKPY